MKLKYTKRMGGHFAVTLRAPIHLTEEDVLRLMDFYIASFGGRRSRKTLNEAVRWYAQNGVCNALCEAAAAESDEEAV